jgi:hypothetical protein
MYRCIVLNNTVKLSVNNALMRTIIKFCKRTKGSGMDNKNKGSEVGGKKQKRNKVKDGE